MSNSLAKNSRQIANKSELINKTTKEFINCYWIVFSKSSSNYEWSEAKLISIIKMSFEN